jgi:hypothetical protein
VKIKHFFSGFAVTAGLGRTMRKVNLCATKPAKTAWMNLQIKQGESKEKVRRRKEKYKK